MAQFKEAEPFVQESLAIRSKFGDASTEKTKARLVEVQKEVLKSLYDAQQYKEALPYANGLFKSSYASEQYKEALYYAEKVRKISELSYSQNKESKQHALAYATSLYNVSSVYLKLAQFKEAEPFAQESLTIRSKFRDASTEKTKVRLVEVQKEVLKSLHDAQQYKEALSYANGLFKSSYASEQYKEALYYAEKVREISELSYSQNKESKQHALAYATSLYNVSSVYLKLAQFKEAEPFVQESWTIRSKFRDASAEKTKIRLDEVQEMLLASTAKLHSQAAAAASAVSATLLSPAELSCVQGIFSSPSSLLPSALADVSSNFQATPS